MPYLYLIRLALRPLVTLLGLFVSLSVQLWAQTPAPTASQNYVLEQMPRDGLPSLTAVSGYQALQTRVSYFDGLGRPVQSVQWRGSGTGTQDIITNATAYDPFGRPNRTLIPTALGSASGYTSQTTIQNTAATFYGDTAPFSETRYEASPLNRTTQQFGPGQFWQTNNRPVNTAYSTANTSVFRYIVQADGSLNALPAGVSNPYYPANDLTVKTITDEQGNLTKEFSDLQGRVIRRDVIVSASEVLSTQYVYDDLGRLTAVIPPKYPSASSITITGNPAFDELAFYYQYDGRGRIIRKHIPGAGWTELIYDTSDRLVMTQDEQDRADVKWRFTKYDGLNRPIRTGRKLSGLSRAFLQSEFDALTRETFPATFVIAETDLLSENRYDAYPSVPSGFIADGAFGLVFPNDTLPMVRGLLTGGRVRNLETNVWYNFNLFYDENGRVIQEQRQNHLGGQDRTDTQYRFNGEVRQVVVRHQKGANGPITATTTRYEYDHLSRPTKLLHAMDGALPIRLATYSYDEVGRMTGKTFGGFEVSGAVTSQQSGSWTQPGTWQNSNLPGNNTLVNINMGHVVSLPGNTSTAAGNLLISGKLRFNSGSKLRLNGGNNTAPTGPINAMTYLYHIRGWLRGMNTDGGGGFTLSNNGVPAPLGFSLSYEEGGNYNGNISKQSWYRSDGGFNLRSYTYGYDKANRLTAATYGNFLPGNTENFTVNGLNYDKNGNLTALNRGGVDELGYNYANGGNRLLTVTDNISSTLGFADVNKTGDDYDYYADGSLKKDLNRNITLIEYNLLKLPRRVTFTNSTTLTIQYDATGQKLRMTTTPASGTATTRDYVGAFQYLNNNLFEIGHPEGRYSPTGGYEFFHKDHLGNVRAVTSQTTTAAGALTAVLTQYTDYDPWGLPLWGALSGGNSTNRVGFNGKEAVSELGPGMLDFNWRLHDATIGRFSVVDGLAEKFPHLTPYQFASNDPVGKIELDGLEGIPASIGADLGLWTSNLSTQDKARIYTQGATVQATGALTIMGLTGAAFTGGRSVVLSSQILRWALSNPSGAYELGAGAAGIVGSLVGYSGNDLVPNASSDEIGNSLGLLFRGTTSGFPGSRAVQALGISSASENPAIATLFAIESKKYGNAVVQLFTGKNLQGVQKLAGNVLSAKEAEIGLQILPNELAKRATLTISVEEARLILEKMGIKLPNSVSRSGGQFDQILETIPKMSQKQINTFYEQAQKLADGN